MGVWLLVFDQNAIAIRKFQARLLLEHPNLHSQVFRRPVIVAIQKSYILSLGTPNSRVSGAGRALAGVLQVQDP